MKADELTSSDVITAYRVRWGLSKAALARKAGIHPSSLSNIENGRMEPYPSQLEKLAAAFTALEEEQGD